MKNLLATNGLISEKILSDHSNTILLCFATLLYNIFVILIDKYKILWYNSNNQNNKEMK